MIRKKNIEKRQGGESLPLAPARKRSSATLSPKGGTPLKSPAVPSSEFIYISNEQHYDQIIERIKTVKKVLWIGTADIKDLYVKDGRSTMPLLQVLSDLAKRGVHTARHTTKVNCNRSIQVVWVLSCDW